MHYLIGFVTSALEVLASELCVAFGLLIKRIKHVNKKSHLNKAAFLLLRVN